MKRLTQKELDEIKANPYTARVTATSIIFTYEFKEFVIRKAEEGYHSPEIFKLAGYDVEALGKPYVYNRVKDIKEEAASPGGLKPPRGMKSAERFARENLKQHRTETSLKILQDRIAYLEQEIEFLKKTELLEQELRTKEQKSSTD